MTNLPMKTLYTAVTFWLFFFVINTGRAQTPTFAKFAQDVILSPDFPNCTRWLDSPAIACFGANTQEEKLFSYAVEQINQTLAPSRIQLRVVLSDDPNATIKLYFSKQTAMPAIIKKESMLRSSAGGFTWYFWRGKKNEITKSVGVVSTELKPKELQHAVFRTILGCIGFYGDPKNPKDSIFVGWDAVELSPIDKRLVAFYYEHVMPGFRLNELRQAIKTYAQ